LDLIKGLNRGCLEVTKSAEMRSQADGSTTTSGTGGSAEEIPLAEVRFFHGIHFNIKVSRTLHLTHSSAYHHLFLLKYVGCMDIPCPRARSEVVAAMRRVRVRMNTATTVLTYLLSLSFSV